MLYIIGKITKIQHQLLQVIGEVKIDSEAYQCNQKLEEFRHLSDEDVVRIVTKSTTKSCILDPIPTTLIKQNLDILAPVIKDILNLSLESGIVPECMKEAIVIPLHKKLTLDLTLKIFRPVSNLTYISRLLEKAVADQSV